MPKKLVKSVDEDGNEIENNEPLKLCQGHVQVTLTDEDFEISPQLENAYFVGQQVIAEGASLDALFVGGHPIKGRNG